MEKCSPINTPQLASVTYALLCPCFIPRDNYNKPLEQYKPSQHTTTIDTFHRNALVIYTYTDT